MFFKLIEFLNECDSKEEQEKVINVVGKVVVPLIVLGILFLLAIIFGLIHL